MCLEETKLLDFSPILLKSPSATKHVFLVSKQCLVCHIPSPNLLATLPLMQPVVAFWGCQHTLPGHAQPLMWQHPQILPTFIPQPALVPGHVPTPKMQHLHLVLWNLMKFPGPYFPRFFMSFWMAFHASGVGKLAEGALHPTVHVILETAQCVSLQTGEII